MGCTRVVAWVTDSRDLPPANRNRALCNRADEFEHAVRAGAGCAILDPGVAGQWLRSSAARAVLSGVPTVIRCTLTPASAREIIELSQWLTKARVSFREHDNLASDIDALLAPGPIPSAELALIRNVAPVQSDLTDRMMVATSVLGRRRAYLCDLAQVCQMPGRTLQWRLSQLLGRSASDLLGASLTLHTAWRVLTLDWPLKKCAAAAGFGSAEALSDYVYRHCGYRPRHMQGEHFIALLDRWAELFRPVESATVARGAV